MRIAADYLLGEHDFSAFRASSCQSKNPVRTVHHLWIVRHGECIYIDVIANAFLHHMVRNIVGVLIAVGLGKQDTDWTNRILATRDRTQGGVTAPAEGLYLIGVEYPEYLRIPRISYTSVV
uniref:tRNA pseudouridine synthase n=1 Tax=Candidatus Kentrum sp. SD TaxID=2126332 RepID=A0A450YM29_9GAMM|nr:MAG: tRNA pseudouridine(38-40) synthase [Candidatus Kentron sp. SD]VFK42575.1 MAG: tRNA pseudouridine(38-40) synthase [Candidatus Kentron sp. SD]VFK77862.1 MAG: tRNA pseudouridine(38-40) synthase [Candidatus Kentron sp. SD]